MTNEQEGFFADRDALAVWDAAYSKTSCGLCPNNFSAVLLNRHPSNLKNILQN